MFQKILFSIILLFAIMLPGCTDQVTARNFGGKMTITLPARTKLVNATWKDSDLWILTRQAGSDEPLESYKFTESSSFGIMNGEITIQESATGDKMVVTSPRIEHQKRIRGR